MKTIKKLSINLGLLLFFTLLIAFMPSMTTVHASEIDMENNYRLNVTNVILVNGKSLHLKVLGLSDREEVSFKSDNPEIASINQEGLITANRVGVTTITATVKNGTKTKDLRCDVTVGPPAFSVKITKSRIILGLDESDLLKVILKPSNTTEVARFSSNNSNIASISTGGRVTAKNLGMTYLFALIDATYPDGKRKTSVCTIIVTKPEDAPLLDAYFNEHPELDLIPSTDLSSALEEFFNGSPVEKDADNVSPTPVPMAQSEETQSKGLVESLDAFLDERFNLAELRSAREAANSSLVK